MKKSLAFLMTAIFSLASLGNTLTNTTKKKTPKKSSTKTEWTIDKAHTSVRFDVTHLGITKVEGSMQVIEGTVKTDPKDVTKTELYVKLDAKTIDTGNDMRDNHVRGDDFLAVAKHPHVIFKSTKVSEDKKTKDLLFEGDLTLRGVTKKVTLRAKAPSPELRMPKGEMVSIIRGTTASTKFNRFDFGVNYGKDKKRKSLLDKIKDNTLVVGNEIGLTINTQIFRKVPNQVAKADIKK